MTETALRFELADHVARLTLDRPEANALDLDLARALMQAAIRCDHDPDVRAVLLTGTGRFFCAGGDLRAMSAYGALLPSGLKEMTVHLHAAVSHFVRMRAPLVIAVNGAAAGAGMSLAAAGDLVLAAESATFTMAYTAAGLVPDGASSWLLPRLIGLRRTQELMLTNRRLTAPEAHDWGLVTRVVADDRLADEAAALAATIARGPTAAFAGVKRLLCDSFTGGLETRMEAEGRGIAEVAATADGREGIAAFLERRRPTFRGV